MVYLTKKRIKLWLLLFPPLLAFLLIMVQINSFSEDNCLKEVDDLYAEQQQAYHESRVALSNRNWYHILESKKLIENNLKFKEIYAENAHEQRDLATEYINTASKIGKELVKKKNECRTHSSTEQSWMLGEFFIIILGIILSLIYIKRILSKTTNC